MLDPYERLANAIIIQAVQDYRKETGTAKTNPEKAKIIAWILSGDFSAITDLKPEVMAAALQKEDERIWEQ